MKFIPLKIPDSYLIEPELKCDERGFFARTLCLEIFDKHRLNTQWEQCNVSFNAKKGTLRGMHFQKDPHPEIKIVRCTRGAIYDVVIDLRSSSPTFKQWEGYELTQENYRMLYIPGGCAHGFLTFEDNTEVFYHMSTSYVPECASGVRWDDPVFGIDWPGEAKIISAKDQQFPDFS